MGIDLKKKDHDRAIMMLITDKLSAWDGNGVNNGNGSTSTANFISGMIKPVPPLNDLFNMAGLDQPSYLKGKAISGETSLGPVEKSLFFLSAVALSRSGTVIVEEDHYY